MWNLWIAGTPLNFDTSLFENITSFKFMQDCTANKIWYNKHYIVSTLQNILGRRFLRSRSTTSATITVFPHCCPPEYHPRTWIQEVLHPEKVTQTSAQNYAHIISSNSVHSSWYDYTGSIVWYFWHLNNFNCFASSCSLSHYLSVYMHA